MWVGSMTLEYCELYFVGSSNNLWKFVDCSYIHVELGNLGGVILPALHVGNIVRPMSTRKRHCSFHCYSLKSVLIDALSMEIPALFTLFKILKLALFIVRISINFFLFSKLFPMKVRQWVPILDVKYRIERNHAIE